MCGEADEFVAGADPWVACSVKGTRKVFFSRMSVGEKSTTPSGELCAAKVVKAAGIVSQCASGDFPKTGSGCTVPFSK